MTCLTLVCIPQFTTSYKLKTLWSFLKWRKDQQTMYIITLISIMFLFCFSSMVLIESVKSVRLTLLAMTLRSSAMLFLFIMVLKQKKDSILLRMKKITVTEAFLGLLKRNWSWSIPSQQDTAETAERNKYCQTKILKHSLAC